MVILCGAGDRPIDRLGGRTPLEYASTPHLDGLAQRGSLGRVRVIGADVTPESDSGAMALLGYDPVSLYTGRGPLEALGMGFWASDAASVGFRVNFASRDEGSGRLDRRTARDLDDHELQALAASVREQVGLESCPQIDYRMTAFGRHRGIVCFTSQVLPLSGEVTNTDPGFRRVGAFGVPNRTHSEAPVRCVPLEPGEAAANTARAVEAFVRESSAVLEGHPVNRRRGEAGRLPANVILFRDGGHELPDLDDFGDRHGMSVSLYGQVPAEHGLCKLFGGRFREARPGIGESDAAYHARLVHDLAADPSGLVFVHLKGADEPGHDDAPLEKAAALESIDRTFVGPLVEQLDPDDVLVVTGDHATPCEAGIHVTDPVPTVLVAPGLPPDAAARFTESEADRKGELGVTRAIDLLPCLQGVLAR
jgi:2,3-bisphosphoglycerate-independent phosphoglycerate mutase